MQNFGVSCFCLILILACQTWAQGNITSLKQDSEPRTKTQWRMKLTGSDYHDQRSQFKIIGIGVELKTHHNLTETLLLDVQPLVKLQSGQSQTYESADKPENKVALNQAALHYSPTSFLKFSGGALNQIYAHTSLLMDPIAFPAGRIETSFGGQSFKTSLLFESAIPTSTSLSSNTKELEPTPALNAVSLKFKTTPNDKLKTSFGITAFAFSNLPSSVAQQSALLGNTVDKISEASYRFRHEYQGLEYKFELESAINRSFSLIAGAEYLINERAPTELNTAYLYFGKGIFRLKRNLDLNVSGGYFSLAQDSAVSFFNGAGFETNRNGYFTEATLAFNKEGFNLGLRFTDSEVQYSNTYQSRENLLMLKMETSYANL